MPPKIIEKTVGVDYEVNLYTDTYEVLIYVRGKLKETYKLKRYCDAINVYSSLKKVKDCKYALQIHDLYPINVLRRIANHW